VDTQAWDFVKNYYPVSAMTPWNIVIVNDRAFSRLDKKTQDALLAAAKTAEARGFKMQQEATSKLEDILKSKGMAIKQPSPQFMAELQKIGDQLIMEWAKAAGEDGKKVLDAYKKGN